jgi:hypothetical protein
VATFGTRGDVTTVELGAYSIVKPGKINLIVAQAHLVKAI